MTDDLSPEACALRQGEKIKAQWCELVRLRKQVQVQQRIIDKLERDKFEATDPQYQAEQYFKGAGK